jgi:hypothetical protein
VVTGANGREVLHQMKARALVVVVIGLILLLLLVISLIATGLGTGLRSSGGMSGPTPVITTTPCGSNTPRPSNLPDEEMARLEDFAESLQREGYLRPALPAYVPPGLRPSAAIIDDGEEHIAFALLPTPQESSAETAVPLSLDIGEQFDPAILPLLCGDGSNLGDADLLDPGLECVRVGGRPADLKTLEEPDGTVSHDISFELDDLDIFMSFVWKRGPDASRETEEQMKQELLRAAESMTAP